MTHVSLGYYFSVLSTVFLLEVSQAYAAPISSQSTSMSSSSSGSITSPTTTNGTSADKTKDAQLFEGCEIESYPSILAGRLLMGVADDLGENSLAILDLDQHRITPIGMSVLASSLAGLSPDGTQIALTTRLNGVKSVTRADWDGSNQISLSATKGLEFGGWSGATLTAFNTDGQVLLLKADGSNDSVPTSSGEKQTPRSVSLPPRVLEARLATDNNSLLFSTTKFWPGSDICIRSITSNIDSCPLTGSNSYNGARWNKSAEFITYSVGDETSATIGVLNRKTKVKSTFSEADGRNFDPLWNPIGEGIAFVNEAEGKFSILFQDTAGKPGIPIVICSRATRIYDWHPSKTIEVEALRVKRSTEGK